MTILKNRKHKKSGFVLATLLLVMVLMGLLIPLLWEITNQDTKWSVQQKDRTVASQLASAGIERALWKLKETNNNWDYLLTTGPLAGYNNDVPYRDVNKENGVYIVKITSTVVDRNQMILTCQAKDTKASQQKAVQAIARRSQVGAAIHGNNLVNSSSLAGRFVAHWGPLYDTGNLYLNTIDINQLYPRKFAAGSIAVVNSIGFYATRDLSPSSPNSDNQEYFAYAPVPTIPTPDFDFYRASAASLGTYYPLAKILTSTVTAPGRILFFESDATINGNNKFIQGIVIVIGKLTLNGDNTFTTTPYPNDYTVTPPSTAFQEYQKNCPLRKNATGSSLSGDTGSQDEYPGDGGLATSKPFAFGNISGEASGKKVSIKGFVYVGTELSGGNTNPQVIHGALAISKSAIITSGFFEVFYDPTIQIRTASSEIYISQWQEIIPSAF